MTSAITVLMTADEARACITEIRGHLAGMRRSLIRLHDGEGWVSLGYTSFEACAVAEFPEFQRAYLQQQLNAAITELNILKPGQSACADYSEVGLIPEFHLRPLTNLGSPQLQRDVWAAANDTAPATGITGRHVQNVVNEVRERIAAGVPANEAIADVSLSIRIPTPTEAKTLARETGLLVIASNNRMYDDRSEEQIAAEHKVTTLLYRVFEAINVLAGVTVPPSEYVALMRPDQSYHLADHLESAAVWLNELTEEWRCHSTHP